MTPANPNVSPKIAAVFHLKWEKSCEGPIKAIKALFAAQTTLFSVMLYSQVKIHIEIPNFSPQKLMNYCQQYLNSVLCSKTMLEERIEVD